MITLEHSNRLEVLAEKLVESLVSTPADPLQADCIVVPNPGMGRWLAHYYAERCGIAANLVFPLSATFFWQVLRAWLPEQDPSPFDKDSLIWRIQALLPGLL